MYTLKNNCTGEKAVYQTSLEIFQNGNRITFRFTAEHSQCYCADKGYNKIHSCGDACEILIGSDPERKTYYEIEISPANDLMIAKMVYRGITERGQADLDIQFVEQSFIQSHVEKTADGYIAELSFDEKDILTGDGDIYFNAYRIETDGGEMNKHLFALNPTLCRRFHTQSYFLPLKEYLAGTK